jgi:hypothetical protein
VPEKTKGTGFPVPYKTYGTGFPVAYKTKGTGFPVAYKTKGTGFPVPLEGARPEAAVLGGWCRSAVHPPWGSGPRADAARRIPGRRGWGVERSSLGVVIHE